MPGSTFISLDKLVSAVLLGIGDETNKRFEVKAMQWVLDTIRRIHVNYSPYYKEVRLNFTNEDLFTIDYPTDTVKILSVGMYREDKFWSFTKNPDMSILASEEGETEFDPEANEGFAVPPKGVAFSAQPTNTAYWVDDPQHCRIMVRMFSYYKSASQWMDRTEWLKVKGVVVRYKATGVDCAGDICVPVEARDLVVNKVIYEFVRRGWGIPMTNYNVELQRQELDALQTEYEALLYEPHNFWEFRDSIYASLNTTARR
jgi:hypothetical protein